MDPNEALIEIIAAAFEGRGDDMFSHAEDLAVWMDNGGFPPSPKDVYQGFYRTGFNPLPGEESEKLLNAAKRFIRMIRDLPQDYELDTKAHGLAVCLNNRAGDLLIEAAGEIR